MSSKSGGAEFIRNRIFELRVKKGVSEYKMSIDLGHSKTYIQSIMSGRSLPSVSELFAICDYFTVDLSDFFDREQENPVLINEIVEIIRRLDDGSLKAILNVAAVLDDKSK
ncbi:MAG: helix-turn-helix domain-containing protein [Oscillospiraceae bacterium]|nr:helix-turn-helix domain-containing protein [Oscillospiraceae bacterium]